MHIQCRHSHLHVLSSFRIVVDVNSILRARDQVRSSVPSLLLLVSAQNAISPRPTHAVIHPSTVEKHLTSGKVIDTHPPTHSHHTGTVGIWHGLTINMFGTAQSASFGFGVGRLSKGRVERPCGRLTGERPDYHLQTLRQVAPGCQLSLVTYSGE